MTVRIVTAAKPSRKRPYKPAQAAHIDQRIVVASKPGKRVRPPDGTDQEVPESVKAFFKRMMQSV